MSSGERLGPSVPTRLRAEPTTTNDRFETQVFYAGAIRKFLMIDHYTKPHPRNWVAVKQLTDTKICVQRFRGQKHFGVVRILRVFQLRQSVLWHSLHSLIWFLVTITS